MERGRIQMMKQRKRIISILSAVILLVSLIIPSQAFSKINTLQDKAEFLDTLSILTETYGDYRLNDKLSRSEAAAFAVRLMGKELHVLLNASTLKEATFPDVDENSWYAPYVGFCTKEGIISGDTKGLFNPNDYITEKGFLKIILGVLDYKFEKDYAWENVYKKAYEVGLVTELMYIAKSDDNTEYKRGDAVNVLYNALTLKSNSTGREIFYNLIDSNIITKEMAIEIGLLEQEEPVIEPPIVNDEIFTEIEEILIFDDTNISIHFNENITEIKKLKIYESANTSKLLEHEIDVIDNNYVFVKTKSQTPGMEYLVEIEGIKDEEGNVLDSLVGIFTGFTQEKIESSFFRIQSIRPLNESSILLYFTHPINLNVENSFTYNILEGNEIHASGRHGELVARIYSSERNCILLSMKNGKFEENNEYIVEIDGKLTSGYGVKLNDGKGDRMVFKATSGKVENLKLNEIITFNSNTLMLVFNKDINPFLAQQIYNFYITDEDGRPITIEKTKMMDNIYLMAGQTLYIILENDLYKGKNYYLTINNLNDISRNEYINEMVYSFKADYGSADKLRIEKIDEINNQKIEVYFTNSLDQTTALIKENYVVTYRYDSKKIYPTGVMYDLNDDPMKVTLYFSDADKFVGNREYELHVGTQLRDYVGNTLNEVLRKSFNASTSSKESPYISDAVAISSDAVKLVFSDAVAFDYNNLALNNYILEYNENGVRVKKTPLSVLYAGAREIVLMFDELKPDVDYTLKFNAIVDYSGSSFKVLGDGTNYVEFTLKIE